MINRIVKEGTDDRNVQTQKWSLRRNGGARQQGNMKKEW
jgi:hypothetical protein